MAAPVDTSNVIQLFVKPTFACDPLKAQYIQASDTPESTAEMVGPFMAWDPDKGSWPLSEPQKRILVEVTTRVDDDWIDNILLPLIDTEGGNSECPSLRLIDWFVTNYSKSNGIAINDINIHAEYISVRKAYQCRNFDPFRRNLKITFMRNGTRYLTTVGQLNFVLWADSTGTLQYVKDNKNVIDENMTAICKATKQARNESKKNGTKVKRKSLSTDKIVKCRITKTNSYIRYGSNMRF